MRLSLIISLIALTALSLSCSETKPVEKRQKALDKLAEAHEIGIDRSLSKMYKAADDSFRAATDEIARQEAKTGLGRSYSRAEELLDFVDSILTSAKDSVTVLNSVYSLRVDSLKTLVEARLDSAGALVKEMESEKADEAQFVMLRRALAGLRMTLARCNKDLKSGAYAAAATTLEDVDAKSKEVLTQLHELQ